MENYNSNTILLFLKYMFQYLLKKIELLAPFKRRKLNINKSNNLYSQPTITLITLILFYILPASNLTAQVSCGDISDYTTVCIGSPSTFSAATTGTAATTTNPGNDYGCLSSSPNPAWFYFKASSGGSLNIIQTNSNLVDVDGAIWGPFDSITDMTSQCGAFGAPLACDYASAPGFNFSITATTGKYYALLVTNYSGTATEISLTDGGSTASTDCRADIVTSKTVDNSTPEVGDTITWTLTAENKGISDAS